LTKEGVLGYIFLMRKLSFVFILILCVAFPAMAEDEETETHVAAAEDDVETETRIGLTLGLEFGIVGANKPNGAEKVGPYIFFPLIAYNNSFFDNTFAVSAKLSPMFGFTKGFHVRGGGEGAVVNDDGDEVYPIGLYSDVILSYNLFLSDMSSLSFTVRNEVNDLALNPRLKDSGPGMNSIFYPNIKYNHSFDGIGAFSAGVTLPTIYLTQWVKDADTIVYLEPVISWNSPFGLWIEVKNGFAMNEAAKGGGDSAFQYCILSAFYSIGKFMIISETVFPANIDAVGVSTTPSLQYAFTDRFAVCLGATFSGIGSASDVSIMPVLSMSYSF
jgi:hypothetical protein